MELFEKLNIVIKPGDLDGLSSQIQDGNVAALEKIQEDQTERYTIYVINLFPLICLI